MKPREAPQSGPSRKTIGDEVHQKLRWALITGAMKAGETVTIRGLAERLDVSTMPVRDSLKRLTAERGLEILPNRCVRVPILTDARLSGLFAIRRALEGLATEHATPLLTDYQLALLKELCNDIDDGIATNQIDDYLAGNHAFHFTIYGVQPNTDLFSMIETLWLQTGPALREKCAESGLVGGFNVFHREALAALRARDAKSACASIAQDIKWAEDRFIGGSDS